MIAEKLVHLGAYAKMISCGGLVIRNWKYFKRGASLFSIIKLPAWATGVALSDRDKYIPSGESRTNFYSELSDWGFYK